MRVELDKPLTKTKLKQILKIIGNDAKNIKVIMGTEIFNIDTIVSKNNTAYLCTDAKETSDFFAKKDLKDNDKKQSDIKPSKNNYPYTLIYNNDWETKWLEYCKKMGIDEKYYIGDCPNFDNGAT